MFTVNGRVHSEWPCSQCRRSQAKEHGGLVPGLLLRAVRTAGGEPLTVRDRREVACR